MQLNWLDSFEAKQRAELFSLYKQQWWTQDRSFDEFAIMLDNSDLSLACYSDSDELLAFSRVLSDRVFKAIIFDVIVASAHQAQGIGEKLVSQIINHPKLINVKSFELFCPESIAPFYEKQGFKRSNSVYLEKNV